MIGSRNGDLRIAQIQMLVMDSSKHMYAVLLAVREAGLQVSESRRIKKSTCGGI